ncbi:hypothetical protein B0J14DRAFT_205298 [Halenospora varia]|nr:hypothetical protein B0J14DRAFT_205298 [Halenospora varia]
MLHFAHVNNQPAILGVCQESRVIAFAHGSYCFGSSVSLSALTVTPSPVPPHIRNMADISRLVSTGQDFRYIGVFFRPGQDTICILSGDSPHAVGVLQEVCGGNPEVTNTIRSLAIDANLFRHLFTELLNSSCPPFEGLEKLLVIGESYGYAGRHRPQGTDDPGVKSHRKLANYVLEDKFKQNPKVKSPKVEVISRTDFHPWDHLMEEMGDDGFLTDYGPVTKDSFPCALKKTEFVLTKNGRP